MGDTDDVTADVERLDAIRDRWERFDNTGDASLVVEFLADDIVLLPPGGAPIEGRAAVVESLEGFPSDAYDVEHANEDLLLDGDLAVDYVSVTGTKQPGEDGDETPVSLKGVDVYRRADDGPWELAISIWNDQA